MISDPTFGAFIHLIHITRPYKQLLIELELGLAWFAYQSIIRLGFRFHARPTRAKKS